MGVLTQFDFLYLEGVRGGTANVAALASGKWEATVKKSLAGASLTQSWLRSIRPQAHLWSTLLCPPLLP